jgi:prolyl oligopeptidase
MKNKKIQKENDPYRWLEKTGPKTNAWVKKNEKESELYFSRSRVHKKLEKRFENLFRFDSVLLPTKRNDLYFFRQRKADEEAHSLYVKRGLHGKPILLLNPEKLPKGIGGIISNWKVSKDGRYIGLDVSEKGNDQCHILIFDVKKKKLLSDVIKNKLYPYFGGWNEDASGFWYVQSSGEETGSEKYYKKIYYHKIGTPISADTLYFGESLGKMVWPYIVLSDDYRYLFVNVADENDNTSIYIKSLKNNRYNFVEITKGIKGKSVIASSGSFLYLLTNNNAPFYKVLRAHIDDKKIGEWKNFIKEGKSLISSWALTKNYMFLEYLENVSSQLYRIDLNKKTKRKISLPQISSVDAMSRDFSGDTIFFSFSSFNIPNSIWIVKGHSLKPKKYWSRKINAGIENTTVKREWVKSKDGTKIPIFIVHKKGLKLNGKNPALVYAYGGFDVSVTPQFYVTVVPFIEDGGIYVVANVRGGGEFGKKWHESVLKQKRHKIFEDFAAVLRHLNDRKYTNPDKISIWGGSNGGLLMSVMMLQYPELYKAAVVNVPVTDMLRFHLFNGGRWWIREYGDPDNAKMRRYLLKYSPYHNVKVKNYPSALFITSDQDDRVHPMHSFKMFARLKENKNQKNTMLLRVEKNAGHSGAGKILPMIKRTTDMFTFVYKELGMD